MTTALTSGIKISVNCRYEDKFSNPSNQLFIFSYGIEIENKNSFPIQLMSRHWYILDSNTKRREVEGEGVIGEQPVILAGEKFIYRSTCDFTTDTGRMCGYYNMINKLTNQQFKVEIPDFMLIVPYKLN